MTTTTEQLEANKKLARDYIDQVFNQHNPSKAADFVTGDVVWHGKAATGREQPIRDSGTGTNARS
jgi:predicted SnoaL-like aldol condensation-catalyzing enzyme